MDAAPADPVPTPADPAAPPATVVLLDEVLRDDPSGNGVHWTLEGSPDLNVNLVHLDPGACVPAHVNDALDVVFVVVAGSGRLRIDGDDHPLVPTTLAVARRGAERAVHAGPHGVSYLTVHRRRSLGLGATRSTRAVEPCDEGGEAPCFAHLLDED